MQCLRRLVILCASRDSTSQLCHLPRGSHRTLATRPLSPRWQNLNVRRSFCNQIPGAILPPLVFTGLLLTLWAWKCLMLVVFQNKIIFMPGLPPNARQETIADYAHQCGGILWREERIKSSDGTDIALCVADVQSSFESQILSHVYVVYFQGNASSLPSRLPFLSPIMRGLRDMQAERYVCYTMVCVSYRGYWKSKGRASEKGILEDACAAIEWIRSSHEAGNKVPSNRPASIVLWGQSIGAGVATSVAAHHELFVENIELKMIILESPFTNTRDMLVTIYPQKWLPYRYLWPFLRTHLDSLSALDRISQQRSKPLPAVVILEAGKDELVPKTHGTALEQKFNAVGIPVKKRVVTGAFHTEVMSRPFGRRAAIEAIQAAIGE